VTSVSASATGGGTSMTFTAGNIAIVGAKASGNEISVSCTPRNVPALTDTDCSKSNYAAADATITCTTSLADRFKNKLGVATLVELRTEAGAAGLPTSTPAYTIQNPPANLGKAVNTITVTGYGLPANVDPFVGEYGLQHDWDGCGLSVHNPRDGLVSIIAAVSGEEGFVDGSNGCPADGLYTTAGATPGFPACQGEFYADLGEPYVDYNDNGIRDANEPFIDANGNRAYDGPNGRWDAKTIIWAETRVLYTGYTVGAFQGGTNLASRFFASPVPPAPSPQPTFAVTASVTGPPPIPATSDSISLYFADANFNLPTSRTTYAASIDAGAKATATFGAAGNPDSIDGLGMAFTTQFCNAANAAACASSCLHPVCHPTSNVGSFGYGAFGYLTVTGGTQPDGGVCAYATSTLTTGSVKVSLTLPVCGTSL